MQAYLLGWLLLIEKWNTEKDHVDVSEFVVCFKNYLEENSDTVTCLIQNLLLFLPNKNERCGISQNFNPV